MTDDIRTLRDVTAKLEAADIKYMVTGSVALNHYAQPRFTRDIDLVVAFFYRDVKRIFEIFGDSYYVSEEAALQAVLNQTSFNLIHNNTLMKVDLMIRKNEEYRKLEFERRQRVTMQNIEVWIVSKEDLILSKLDWARDSQSERQISDVENLIASGCDMEYLKEWSAKLNLADMLTRVTP